MDKNITIELQVRAPESTTQDDTAGYLIYGDGGCVPLPKKGGQLFHIAPNLAIRLTLPDPAPVARDADVQGFIAVEHRPDATPEPQPWDGAEVQGYLWPLWILGGAGAFAAGYGASAFMRDISEEKTYHKYP